MVSIGKEKSNLFCAPKPPFWYQYNVNISMKPEHAMQLAPNILFLLYCWSETIDQVAGGPNLLEGDSVVASGMEVTLGSCLYLLVAI